MGFQLYRNAEKVGYTASLSLSSLIKKLVVALMCSFLCSCLQKKCWLVTSGEDNQFSMVGFRLRSSSSASNHLLDPLATTGLLVLMEEK